MKAGRKNSVMDSLGQFPNSALLGSGIFCNHSAVTMRVGARLAGAKLTHLPRSSTTGWTMDGEYLFWAEFLFHCGEIIPQN
jgi:hypothetical protein